MSERLYICPVMDDKCGLCCHAIPHKYIEQHCADDLCTILDRKPSACVPFVEPTNTTTNPSDPHVPGAKLDAGKPEAGLLLDFRRALTAVAEVSTFGAHKYTRSGWATTPDGMRRYTDALLRHLLAGDSADSESGLPHLYHIAWNALVVLELKLRQEERMRQ